jgi:AcrR family transcriptional regulator
MKRLRYVDYLIDKLHDATGAKKIIRTNIQLQLAMAQFLEERDFSEISVTLITERAGLAHGTLYRYYAGRQEFIIAVLSDFFVFIQTSREPGLFRLPPREAVYRANLHYVHIFQNNIGIMRCLFHLRDTSPAVGQLSRDADARLVARVLRFAKPVSHDVSAAAAMRDKLLVYSLLGMVDELLLRIFSRGDPSMAPADVTPEAIAEATSLIWYRALHQGADATLPQPASKGASAARGSRLSNGVNSRSTKR